MENLKGRVVEMVSGAMFASRLGQIVEDHGEMLQVYYPPVGDADTSKTCYHAKFQVISNEYLFDEIPDAVGVYLIAKPAIEKCA